MDLSFIIPAGRPDPKREKILDWIIAYYRRHFPKAEFVVVRDESEPYCKARALNRAVARSHGDQLILLDADILVDSALIRANLTWAVVHSNVRDLTFEATEEVLSKKPRSFIFNTLSSKEEKRQRRGEPDGRGGIQLIPRKVWDEAGGYDERFRGWGGEDVAFITAAKVLCGEPRVLSDVQIYHLEHPPPNRRISRENSFLQERYQTAKDMRATVEEKYQKVDFFSRAQHYTDHLLPTWNALPEVARGDFYVTHPDGPEGCLTFNSPNMAIFAMGSGNRPVVAASVIGIETINRPMVIVDHGAGQYYLGDAVRDWDNVVLVLTPNASSVKSIRRMAPKAAVEMIGCPKMDRWVGFKKEREDPPVVAVSFHFDLKTVPEQRTSWPHYKNILPWLAQSGYKVLGHGHPRIIEELIPYYEQNGIEVVRDFTEVLERADLYCNDHCSTLYEFAYTGRPVVVMNAPWYRRDVEHGLRYWEYANVGVNCNEPEEWLPAIAEALVDSPEQQELRKRAVEAVYPFRGVAARVAAQEILSVGKRYIPRMKGDPVITIEVTNTSRSTVPRGGYVFAGLSTHVVQVADRVRMAEVRACRCLQVRELDSYPADIPECPVETTIDLTQMTVKELVAIPECPVEMTVDLAQMTIKELVAMAKEQDISTSKLRTKAQLLKALGA